MLNGKPYFNKIEIKSGRVSSHDNIFFFKFVNDICNK